VIPAGSMFAGSASFFGVNDEDPGCSQANTKTNRRFVGAYVITQLNRVYAASLRAWIFCVNMWEISHRRTQEWGIFRAKDLLFVSAADFRAQN
jgi:hypothetical protein